MVFVRLWWILKWVLTGRVHLGTRNNAPVVERSGGITELFGIRPSMGDAAEELDRVGFDPLNQKRVRDMTQVTGIPDWEAWGRDQPREIPPGDALIRDLGGALVVGLDGDEWAVEINE